MAVEAKEREQGHKEAEVVEEALVWDEDQVIAAVDKVLHARTHTHTLTHTHTHSHSHTHTHSHMHARSHTHTHIQYNYIRACVCVYMCTHTYTRARARTHTHTHSLSLSLSHTHKRITKVNTLLLNVVHDNGKRARQGRRENKNVRGREAPGEMMLAILLKVCV